MSVLDEAPVAVPVRRDLPALAAGLVTVTAWGSAFVGIRAAGHALSPGSIALGRLLVSCAALGTVAAIRREPLPARRDLWQIAAYGVLWLGLYSVALNAAERRVDAGTAAMLVNTGPILIAIMAGIFLREGFPPGLFAGCAVALLVLATIRDPLWAVAYLFLFGLGTVVGMMLITAVIALPFAYSAGRFAIVNRYLGLAAGLLSLGVGLFLAYQIGLVDGLFTANPQWSPK